MIIWFIFIAVAVISFIIGFIISDKYYSATDIDVLFKVIGIFCLLISLTIGLVFILQSVGNPSQREYEKWEIRRNDLVLRLEDEETKYYAQVEIIQFNDDLYNHKVWGNNKWTSWFYNQKIAKNIDFIEIGITP